MTCGVKDRISGGLNGNRVGCKDGSELLDEQNFPDAGNDDMTDNIEKGYNNTAIEGEMHGTGIYKQVTPITVTLAHTQQPTEPPASNSHNKPYHKTQQRRHQ